VPTLFDDLAATAERVASTSKRNDKVAAFAAVLVTLEPAEIKDAVAFLTGQTATGRIGVGWATLAEVGSAPAATPTLCVLEVARMLARVAEMSGQGVVAGRRAALDDLFALSTHREQLLLSGVLSGGLRQGALEGVVLTAVAKAAGVPVADVRRATMMAGDLGQAAHAALTGGAEALAAVQLLPGRPVQPMLASTAASAGDAVAEVGLASVEWKLDGARVQAHRRGSDVLLFTRNLNDITERLPGVVDVVRSLPGGDLVLDGEVLGPQAFFFDAMHLDGTSIHDEPLSARRGLLESFIPKSARLQSILTSDPAEADAFMRNAIEVGHEGVMVKGVDEPYEAGRRGTSWRKVKPVYTVDLVVTAVEWGHGRRSGRLSNLHLGARGDDGAFVMVGKTFKGLTDEMLAWQTERFLSLEVGRGAGRDGHVVYVEPLQVVEIAIDGVQASTRYPGGVVLRFARVKRYRHDKSAEEADPIGAVQAFLR
jgi:DNA ligase-1